MKKKTLIGLAVLLQSLTAQASEPAKVCEVQQPKAPSVEWRGEAAYQAKAKVTQGRVTAIEILSLKGGVDRKAQRALVMAIEMTLRKATCQPGDHVFEQRFDFDLREGAASAAR